MEQAILDTTVLLIPGVIYLFKFILGIYLGVCCLGMYELLKCEGSGADLRPNSSTNPLTVPLIQGK